MRRTSRDTGRCRPTKSTTAVRPTFPSVETELEGILDTHASVLAPFPWELVATVCTVGFAGWMEASTVGTVFRGSFRIDRPCLLLLGLFPSVSWPAEAAETLVGEYPETQPGEVILVNVYGLHNKKNYHDASSTSALQPVHAALAMRTPRA